MLLCLCYALAQNDICILKCEIIVVNLSYQAWLEVLNILLYCVTFLQDISTSLCFRGQRIFLHNGSGWFGSVPLEASGDFGIHPEEGEFHLMCQVSITTFD